MAWWLRGFDVKVGQLFLTYGALNAGSPTGWLTELHNHPVESEGRQRTESRRVFFQTHLTTRKAIGEPLVIQAQQMQNGRMPVMNVDPLPNIPKNTKNTKVRPTTRPILRKPRSAPVLAACEVSKPRFARILGGAVAD